MSVIITNSDIQEFKRCRQSWAWSSALLGNLEPNRPPDPFSFGTAIHAGLEAYYSGLSEAEVLGSFAATLYEEVYFEGWGEEDQDSHESNKELGLAMLRHYMSWAPTVDKFKPVWVERRFTVPLMPGYDYGFKPDGLAEDEDGRLWIIEHKTASKLFDSYDYLLTDDQAGRYLWGLREADGLKIEGTIYTFLRKDAPKLLSTKQDGFFSLDKRQNTTYEIARAQMVAKFGKVPDGYADFLEYLRVRGNKFFHRETVRRNPRELDLIGASLRAEVTAMTNQPAIYRSPSQWNCSRCSFFGPCVVKWEGGDPSAILNGEYRQRPVVGSGEVSE